jgi:hypothetical protein
MLLSVSFLFFILWFCCFTLFKERQMVSTIRRITRGVRESEANLQKLGFTPIMRDISPMSINSENLRMLNFNLSNNNNNNNKKDNHWEIRQMITKSPSTQLNNNNNKNKDHHYEILDRNIINKSQSPSKILKIKSGTVNNAFVNDADESECININTQITDVDGPSSATINRTLSYTLGNFSCFNILFLTKI